MISITQVTAAMAAGCLLTIAVALVLHAHMTRVETRRRNPPEAAQDDGEQRIQAACAVTLETVEVFRQPAGAPPDHACGAIVRSKKHLKLISSAVTILTMAGLAVREATRAQRLHVISATFTAAAMASAATVLVIAPWASTDAGGPPATVPSRRPWRPAPSIPATTLRPTDTVDITQFHSPQAPATPPASASPGPSASARSTLSPSAGPVPSPVLSLTASASASGQQAPTPAETPSGMATATATPRPTATAQTHPPQGKNKGKGHGRTAPPGHARKN